MQPKTKFIFSEVSSHHWFTLNLLLTKMTKPQLLIYFSRYSFWIKMQDIVFIAIKVTSLDMAHCSRPAEISRGVRVWGSWFCHPKHFLSLQVSWDHQFENVFCSLRQSWSQAAWSGDPLVGPSPCDGNHYTCYTCTWLYEDGACISPSNQSLSNMFLISRYKSRAFLYKKKKIETCLMLIWIMQIWNKAMEKNKVSLNVQNVK